MKALSSVQFAQSLYKDCAASRLLALFRFDEIAGKFEGYFAA
jgi:hypothetical protein